MERCDSQQLELLRTLTKLLHGDLSAQATIFSLISEGCFGYDNLTELEKKRIKSMENHLPSEGPVKDVHYYVLGLEDNEKKAVQSREELRSQMLSLDLTIKSSEEEIFSNFYRSYA
jgi:hypothetical protein